MISKGIHFFKIRESALDLQALDSEIRFKIKQRQELGVYEHYDLTKVTHLLLRDIRNPREFLKQHLGAIIRSWAIDINDFEIIRKKEGVAGHLEVLLKKVIWKLLKFYTYRLFSQQREYNFQISNTLTLMEKHYREKLDSLQKELALLKEQKI